MGNFMNNHLVLAESQFPFDTENEEGQYKKGRSFYKVQGVSDVSSGKYNLHN